MSNINTSSIDSNFPVAGQDNSSQGFRDNYNQIVIALNTAKTEITELQTNSLLKIGLSDSALSNDMQEGELVNATLKNPGYNTLGIVGGRASNTINVASGTYHKVADQTPSNTSTTISVTDTWAGTDQIGIYSKIIVEVPCITTATTSINFTIFGQDAGRNLLKEAGLTLPYTKTELGSTLWELSTADNGKNVFLRKLGGPFTAV